MEKILNSRPWTREEEDFVRANYKILTNNEIARRLNRTPRAIEHRTWRLDLVRFKRSPRWTGAEDEVLVANVEKMNDEAIGALIGRTANGVFSRRMALGLMRPHAVLKNDGGHMKHGEGPAIVRVSKFVETLNGLAPYERIAIISKRIDEVRECTMRLYENGPVDRGWREPDNRAAGKLAEILRELRGQLDKEYAARAIVTETQMLANQSAA